MKLCLDTNAYSTLLRSGSNRNLASIQRSLQSALEGASEIFMPVVTYGELLAGFSGGSKEKENRELLAEFLGNYQAGILDVTSETAEWFAILRKRLSARGKMMPTNDLWIASITAQSGSQLLTLDRHFQELPEIVTWIPE